MNFYIYIYLYIYVYNSIRAAASHTPNEMEEKPTEILIHFDSLSLITQVGSEFYMHAIQNKYMFESICSFDTDIISIIHAKSHL